MSVTGAPEGEPMKVGIPIVDQVAGLYATIGVLAALGERARERAGTAGRRVAAGLRWRRWPTVPAAICSREPRNFAWVTPIPTLPLRAVSGQ